MNNQLVNVEVSCNGRIASAPVFAHKDKNGNFVVSRKFIEKLSYKVGYNPEVVNVKVLEILDEAA